MNPKHALILLAATAQAAASGDVQRLDWLQGHWCTGTNEERIEELWTAPASGESIGLNRTVQNGKMSAFEYLRIVRQDGNLTYIAQPGGESPTRFVLEDRGDDWLAFVNPQHDFPQRIEYRRSGEKLTAEISGPGSDGEVMTIPFRFETCE